MESSTSDADEVAENPNEPQFGALDIVEAFTAMRHESRLQISECRTAVEQIASLAATLQQLEANLIADAPSQHEGDDASQLAEALADTECQLSRAIVTVAQLENQRQQRQASQSQAIHDFFQTMNPVRRFFVKPLLRFVEHQQQAEGEQSAGDSLSEGLGLLLARIHQMMRRHEIERLNTEGTPFDGGTMNAIGAIETAEHDPGVVAEQISPGYLWRGNVLKYAEVRVAK